MKGKLFLASLFSIWAYVLVGQITQDFTQVDAHARSVPKTIEKDIALLTNYLVQTAKNDFEKARSIYQWVILNINYDEKAYKKGNKRINRSNQDILDRRKAICWGYASLFKAMCDIATIPCDIISGYSKTSLTAAPDLDVPNHAWNSVKLDGKWYLLDATWDSGGIGQASDFKAKFNSDYFLTPPKYFIVNHLPADPDWQLLACPISLEAFALDPDSVVHLAQRVDCEPATDQLATIEQLNIHDKRLLAAKKTYQFNPTEPNQRELAHAYIDYEAYLGAIAERLQISRQMDSLAIIQAKMIALCESAEAMTELFASQKENCAYNYFNYAITLTQIQAGDELKQLKMALLHFEKAQMQLKDLESNLFTQNALQHCEEYIEYLKNRIEQID